MAQRPSILHFPGEEDREVWLDDGQGGWKAGGKEDGRQGGLWAIESVAVDSSPFWAISSGDVTGALGTTAALHWEAQGLETEEEGTSWAQWKVDAAEDRVLVGSAALAGGVPLDERMIRCMPESFDLSARFLPLPNAELVVWRELGRFVVALGRGGELVHTSVLQARVLDGTAVEELGVVAQSLAAREFFHRLKGCRLWTSAGDAFQSALGSELRAPVTVEPRPAPQNPSVRLALLPSQVALLRTRRAARQRMLRWVSLGALMYLAAFAGWAGWLHWRGLKLEREAGELQVHAPKVEAVRETQLRWFALEQATDPNLYPVEVFHQVVTLLPAEGIRLTDFHLTDGKLVVQGEANSAGNALKFKADVEGSPGLARFAWSFPQPRLLDDNRASFRAEGTLNGGPAHEGQ